MRRLACLLLCLSLTACGFQLRGHNDGGIAAAPVLVRYQAVDKNLQQHINEQLGLHAITLSDDAASARYALLVRNIERSDRALSLGSDARTAERQLRITADLQLLDSEGEPLTPLINTQVQRIFFIDPNNPVGEATERQLLDRELETAMAERIARQLQHWLSLQSTSLVQE